ncbi:MAG: ABC transporter permease [Muribaculaceae bacterium]
MVIKFLIEKEFKQMMRNIVLPIVFVLLPLALINVMPRVATQEVKNLKISIVDNDRSTWSQRLVDKLAASTYFKIESLPSSYQAAMGDVDAGNADFVVEIEPDFERHLVREGVSKVLISANAVNGMKAGLGSSYLSQIIADYSASLREESGLDAEATRMAHFDVMPRYLYNTTLDYKRFMIPALMSMLMILIVGFLPALNIVGEKEKGTIEQINVTPVGRFEFIFSKLIPYWIVGLVILAYAILLAYGIWGILPAGSVATIFVFATIFILVVSSFGLIVSNYSDTTQQAALVMFFFLVIFILLSGLLTPVACMPAWAKAITYINPLRYFIEAMRAIYLKGSGIADLSLQFYALIAYAVVAWILATRSYRKNS